MKSKSIVVSFVLICGSLIIVWMKLEVKAEVVSKLKEVLIYHSSQFVYIDKGSYLFTISFFYDELFT